MVVKTKYGNGTLLGVDIDNGIITYKVLIESQSHEVLPVEERLYNCLSITVLADNGQEVDFSQSINIKP